MQEIVYTTRWLNFDTRRKKMIRSRQFFSILPTNMYEPADLRCYGRIYFSYVKVLELFLLLADEKEEILFAYRTKIDSAQRNVLIVRSWKLLEGLSSGVNVNENVSQCR